MPGRENAMDGVAEELLGWLQTESSWYANAMRGRSGRSPFAADASEAEKLDYYRRQMFASTPDGQIQYDTPNVQGRENLMARLGVSGYAQVYNEVRPKQGRRSMPEPEPVQDAGAPVEPPSLSPMLEPGASQGAAPQVAPPVPGTVPGPPAMPPEMAAQIQDAGPPR